MYPFRTPWPLCGVYLFVLMALPALPQAAEEQFEIRFAGEEFGRLCPAFEIPPVEVGPGELASFDISILARHSISISTGVILPSGATSSLQDIGAFLDPPLPATLPAGSEALSFVGWNTQSVPAGPYRFRFVAITRNEFGDFFSICDIPIEVVAQGGGEACTLTNAVDGFDGDTEINFGQVELGSSAPGVALLSFSVPASSAAGAGQLVQCLPDEAAVLASPGQLAGDFLVVELTYSPLVPKDLAAEVSFYHVADSNGQNLCDPVLAAENPCVRRLQLSGRGTASVVSVDFENQVCGEAPRTDLVVRNETAGELTGLSVDIDPAFEISALGAFSVRDFSIGPAGSAIAERRLRIEFPANPEEHLGGILFIDSGGLPLLETAVPPPACVSVFPLSLDFGDIGVGGAGLRTVLIANNTAEDASVLLSVAPAGSGFSTIANAAALGSGALEELEVEFRPLTLGQTTAELRFDSGGAATVPAVLLSGRGVQDPDLTLAFRSGGLRLSPGSSLVFPDANLNAASSRTFTVVNEGEVIARALRLSSAGADFEVVPSEPIDLEPGTSRDFVVTFRPQETGRRTARLLVTGFNFEEQTFLLQGKGVLGHVTLVATGLNASVGPRETSPYPTIGLESALPTPESLVGSLTITLDSGTLAVDPSVQFLATGTSILFRIEAGSTVARFVGEPDQRRARYQSGTVAGIIRFNVSELATVSGTPAEVAGGPEVGATRVPNLEPLILDPVRCALTAGGIELSVQALSTLREITGVALSLTAAPNTTLNFTPPPDDFANNLFSEWFSDPTHNQHGGTFEFSLPISFTDIRAFASGSLRLHNSAGWSSPATLEKSACR